MRILYFVLTVFSSQLLTQLIGRTATLVAQIPWVAKYVKILPGVGTDLKRFRAFATERFILRQKEGSAESKDLFYHLVRDFDPRRSTILNPFLTFIRLMKQTSRKSPSPFRSHFLIPLSL